MSEACQPTAARAVPLVGRLVELPSSGKDSMLRPQLIQLLECHARVIVAEDVLICVARPRAPYWHIPTPVAVAQAVQLAGRVGASDASGRSSWRRTAGELLAPH